MHVHAVPLPLLRDLRGGRNGFLARETGAGWVVDVPGAGPTRPIGGRMTRTALRAEWMAGAGIATQILSPWMDIQSATLPPAAARDWSRRLNEAMAAEARATEAMTAGTETTAGVAPSGSRALALASVALDDGDAAAADLVAAIDDLGLAGLCLTTSPADGRALSDPSLAPLWAAAAERRVPIMLHPPTRGPSGVLPTLDGLGNVYGRLIDTTTAVADLILSGLLDRHPDLTILLVHGGGFLPYQLGRLDGGYRAGEAKRAELALGSPSAYARRFVYDTVALAPAAIRMLVEVAGADRVALGSDFPFPIGDPAPARTVEATGLAAADRDMVLSGTAGTLFAGLSVGAAR